jgi:YD repeat-containing protein
MKKISIISIIALVFIMSGCKNHLSPDPVLGSLRLVKTDAQIGTSYIGEAYEYNADGSYAAITSCYDAAKTDCLRGVYSYDAAGRVAEIDSYDNSSVLKDKVVNTYDAAGTMISTATTSYAFTPAVTGSCTYAHDAAGNTTSITQGSMGTVTTFTYNSSNKMTAQYWSGGPYSSRSWAYIYNAAGLLARENITDSFGGPHAYHVIYEYDAAGKRAKMSYYSDMPVSDVLLNYTEYYYDTYGNILTELQKAPDGSLMSRKDYTYEAAY